MAEDIVSLFSSLVKIPSPSGSEGDVARFISGYLKRNGIHSHLDDSGKRIRSDSGNLIAELKGEGPTIMFLAHMDTVEVGDTKVNPIIKGRSITSDGRTILGVDNKASVAALMLAIVELKRRSSHPNVIAAFTAREEAGEMGAKYLKPKVTPDYAFVIDGGNPVGTFINSALGQTPFEIRLHGKEMHAAHAEKGINAMKAAGIILSSQKLGRHPDGSYVNISRVVGGSNINIVPGNVALIGEVRGIRAESIKKRFKELESNARNACRMTGCTYEMIRKEKEGAPPFSTALDSGIMRMARKAASSAGVDFGVAGVKGTIEANLLPKGKYGIIGVGRGGKGPHSKSESVMVHELEDLKRLIVAIADSAR